VKTSLILSALLSVCAASAAASSSAASPDVERVLEAWRSQTAGAPEAALDQEVRLSATTVRLLARGRPVGAEQLSRAWGMPLEQVRQILKRAAGRSLELNDQGAVVGVAGLSLEPTEHRVRVGDQDLYAWCAFDPFLIAGFLGRTIDVRSKDPSTGRDIALRVGPDGVKQATPATSVLTVALPDATCSLHQARVGRGSTTCGQMLFFESAASARKWAADNGGVTVLAPPEAHTVARELFLRRLPSKGQRGTSP
jgi:hypothetical protein